MATRPGGRRRVAIQGPVGSGSIQGAAPRARPGTDTALLDRLKTAAWIFDIDHSRIVWANRSALALWTASDLDELTGRDMKPDMSPAVARRLRQYQADFSRGDPVFSECWTIYPGGVPCTLDVLFSGVRLADGRVGMFCEAHETATQLPDTLRSADALLHTQLMISLYSRSGEAIYRNPAARAALDPSSHDLRSRFLDERDHAIICAALESAGEVSRIVAMRTSRGARWHELTARGSYDAVSGEPAVLISEVDVSGMKETEARIRHIAEHDALTRLPNRSTVSVIFARSIEVARAAGESVGLFFLDLDEFKLINDSLGHAVGDEVLIQVAGRLVACCGDGDSVIRLGGDEFLMIVTCGDARCYEAKAEGVVRSLAAPMDVSGRKLTVTPSIGISVYPEDGTDDAALMTSADLAMYDAKAAGRNCWRFFRPVLKEQVESRLELESSIKAGLALGEFEVYYQPRVSTREVRIVGAEALVRWNRPGHGLVMPGTFIPLCEQTGLIDKLGAFVMRAAMRQQRAWGDLGWDVAISINVSQRQLASATFLDVVEDALADSGCDANLIELEMTESLLMQRSDLCTSIIDRLRRQGLHISVDDFGTGYSNLARMHEFAIDCVKIDRSFVERLPDEKALADIIISLCKLMKVKIVAEGVENLSQLLWLRDRGCEEFQGFYFSKPVVAAEFERMLRLQQTRAEEPRSQQRAG